MSKPEPRDEDEFPTPTLMREARGAYDLAMRRALAALGLHDLPRNSAYLLGGLHAGVPFGALVRHRRRSLEQAGTVQALLGAGCLVLDGDDATLTDRGHDAAHACRSARDSVDAVVRDAIGKKGLAKMRAGLTALIEWKEAEGHHA